MNLLDQLRRLRAHAEWADEALYEVLRTRTDLEAAWREYAHVLGSEETWLARLEGRASALDVWPALTVDGADVHRRRLQAGYRAYLDELTPEGLSTSASYRNSAGAAFANAVGDILLHVAMHAQYHRGKVNLLLRQGGAAPAPVDFIAYVRGAPAAVTPPTPGRG